MSQRIPIYRAQDDTYRADSCRPLSEAAKEGAIRLESVGRGQYPGRVLPRGVLPGLKTVGFWDATNRQRWGLDWHQNEGIELTLLERGQMRFAVAGEEFLMKANDLAVTRPWQRHRLGDPHIGPSRLHWIILDLGVRRPHQTWRWPPWIMLAEDDLSELTRMLRQNECPVWKNAAQIGQCFQRIANVLEVDRERIAASWLSILINELLMLLLELLRSQDLAIDERLSQTQRTVELFFEDLRLNKRLLTEEWTVTLMAEACGLGATRFTDYCRRLTNTTPMRRLNTLRLEAAAELLSECPRHSNSHLAEACGFSSPQYFATAFRRHFGCSPQRYHSESDERSG